MKIKLIPGYIKAWLIEHIEPRYLQVIGLALIVVALMLFGNEQPYKAWFFALLPVGILELILIWAWDTTITKFARCLLHKKIDNVVMIGSIPLVWWWFGPNAAGLYFIGFLVNHFGEKQP